VTQNNAHNITVWEDDPGSGSSADGGLLLRREVPDNEALPFPTQIRAETAAPAADNYPPGTPGFRYWVCADALRRASDLWGGLLGSQHKWHPAVGAVLPVKLDQGVDLNAYYDRAALNFFHAPIGDRTVYSGESPDVVCHEFGHAVLDSIRPQLWDVASFEPPAFHESFGDMSAILAALQVPSFRVAVLQETSNELYRSSRLSRLAEQLGWAIRQKWPDQVEADCLRNAVNSLFYHDPDTLPTSAPAKQLSSEPHSFSRVFTGAFMETLALMYANSGHTTEDALQQVSLDLGKILLGAIAHAPVVPEYYAQVGAHMISLATAKSDAYGQAVKTAMVKHGIVSVPGVAAVLGSEASTGFEATTLEVPDAPAPMVAQELDVTGYGLNVTKIQAVTAAQPKRFRVAGAAPSTGDAASVGAGRSALSFFEDLIRRGRLDYGTSAHPRFAVVGPAATVKTHRLNNENGQVVLRRLRIDCGMHKAPDSVPSKP